jgi:hypothetical protein
MSVRRKAVRNLVGLLSLCAVIPWSSAPAPAQTGSTQSVAYEKPLRGAPARRVTGASRGIKISQAMIPAIELLAPDGHAGETISPSPTLYYFVPAPVPAPIRFTISADQRVAPVLEVDIPSPKAAGFYVVSLADFGVRLEPGIFYVWSISATLNAEEPSNDIVASAALLRTVPDATTADTMRTASPLDRASLFARAGLWYDALAAADAAKFLDRHAAFDGLIEQAGLQEPAAFDRRAAAR